jgi:hypothetical protein
MRPQQTEPWRSGQRTRLPWVGPARPKARKPNGTMGPAAASMGPHNANSPKAGDMIPIAKAANPIGLI